jgi:hypothetical protein
MDLVTVLRSQIDTSALVIAAVGALFSIASALYLTSRKISAELRFRRVDLTALYAENLLKSRIELYPEIWNILNRYANVLRDFPLYRDGGSTKNIDGLLKFSDEVSRWANENGLILSTHSARGFAHLRRAIRTIIDASDKNADSILGAREIKILDDHVRRFEIALRVDVGVYEVDKLESRKTAADYGTMNRDALGKNFEPYPELRTSLD